MSSHRIKGQLVQDISFVFSECMRYAKMPHSELRNLGREHLFCNLPHPSGTGSMTCGREAGNRLIAISSDILKLNRLEGRVALHNIRHSLGEALVRRFIKERREIDQQQVDRLISSLGRSALRDCTAKTHFVPCHLLQVEDPPEIKIGPVIFRTRTSFRKRILNVIREYASVEKEEWRRRFLAMALHHYRGFKWVAEVSVPTADEESSRQLALTTVQAAMNFLDVVFGANSTDSMVVGGLRDHQAREGHLSLSSDGKLDPAVSVTFGGPGRMGFQHGWLQKLPAGVRAVLDLCGIALECAVDPNLDRPASRRVLDAVQWYGEGVRETTDGARVVKYVTALERMLMTRKHNNINIAKVVSERAAAFCSVNDLKMPLEQWKRDILRVYDLRSRLVHGDMSPQSRDVVEGVHLGATIARLSILSALNHIGEAGLKSERVPNSRLAVWFDAIVRQSQETAPSTKCVDQNGP
jgi:hypothetical protein